MNRIYFRPRFMGTLLLTVVLMGLTVSTAFADPPGNDDFDTPTVISGLPFSESINTAEATTAADDPSCAGNGATVWYAFTPSEDMVIDANTFGSSYDTTLSVFIGSRDSLTRIICNDDAVGLQSQVQFEATGGRTYYFMVASYGGGSGGDLVFSVDVAPPPPPPPPPLSMEFRINSSGRVVPKTGEATISGTMTCSRPVYAYMFGTVKQKSGRINIRGSSDTFFLCDGETPWNIVVKGDNGIFVAGKADAEVNGSAEDVFGTITAKVTLKGKK